MSQARDCNTCEQHIQAGTLDEIPGICWGCSSSETRGGPVLPAWKPINTSQLKGLSPQMVIVDELAALDRQVGGDHYKGFKIQPMEFSAANGLNALQHTAVKYTVRRKGDKVKRLEDLDKAIHTLEMYKQLIIDGRLDG